MTKRDYYTEIAAEVFKIPAERVTVEQRAEARAIIFGHLYGNSDGELDWLPGWLVKQAEAVEDEIRRLEQEQGLEHSLERIKTLGRLRAIEVVLNKIREEARGGTIVPDLYILDDDQPTTCPKCGARTEILAEDYSGTQAHRCPACGYAFIGELDTEADDLP